MDVKIVPRLGCAVVIKDEDRILLGVRDKEPNKGKWILPGGGVQFLEPLDTAVKREVLEETGLEVDLDGTIGVYEIINSPHEHRVIVYWWAHPRGGTLRPSSDISEVKFFSPAEIRSIVRRGLATETVSRVLRDIGYV